MSAVTVPARAPRTPRTGWASDWSRLYRACGVGAIRHAAPASSDAVTGSVACSVVLCAASRAEVAAVRCRPASSRA